MIPKSGYRFWEKSIASKPAPACVVMNLAHAAYDPQRRRRRTGSPQGVAIPCQFGYGMLQAEEAMMRILPISTTILIAGMLTLPAAAQGTLPRPGKDGPPPPAAQKGPP